MSKYEAQISRLRPLANKSDILAIFPYDCHTEHGGPRAHGFDPSYGLPENCYPDGISRQNVLEYFTITAPFSQRFEFYGFSIGMTLPSAESLITQYELVERFRNEEFRRLKGKTPDQFEIEVCFARKTMGHEVLNSISLYQPNHSEILLKREAFNEQRVKNERARAERANAWKKIVHDDDAMLLDWASHCKPWNNYSESEFVRYAEWLRKASVDERHMAARCWNWDYGYAPLIWIYRRPDCDLATALHIFFGCEPQYYLKFEGIAEHVKRESGHALEAFQMMMDLKKRIESGFYIRSEIHFDIEEQMEYIARYNPTSAQTAATLPANIKTKYAGRRITPENNFGGLKLPNLNVD